MANLIGWQAVGTLFLKMAAQFFVLAFHFQGDRGTRLAQGLVEVLGSYPLRLKVLAKRQQSGASHDIAPIGAGIAFVAMSDLLKVGVPGQKRAAGLDAQNVQPTGFVRYRHVERFVKPARPQQRRVKQVGAIGGANYNHALQFPQPFISARSHRLGQ